MGPPLRGLPVPMAFLDVPTSIREAAPGQPQWQQTGDERDNCYNNWLNYRSLKSAESVRDQLARICQRLGVDLVSTDFSDRFYYVNIRKAIVSGYFMRLPT